MKKLLILLCTLVSFTAFSQSKLERYVAYFNNVDSEYVVNHIPNNQALGWLQANIPVLDCPDSIIEKSYYFRWWALRKHLKKTPDGFVFTEFITPVKHAGKHNTVSSGLAHHVQELRWLRDKQYLDQYMDFWLYVTPTLAKNHLLNFSSWFPHAVYQRFLVDNDTSRIAKAFPALEAEYQFWVKEKQVPSGLYWQFDVRDAMEESISGSRKEKNRRPTLSSYMFGNASALANMASVLMLTEKQQSYQQQAEQIKKLVIDSLWDSKENFFKALHTNGQLDDAKEAIGFIPWYFNLPPDAKTFARAFDELLDTTGFRAPWGLTTAERRHPTFRTHGSGHGCEWDGAVWPFATTQTLRGLGNLLSSYKHTGKMNASIYYDEFQKYAASHQKRGLPYLGEYQDEKTGYWLKGDDPRSSYYNHSAFADLLIQDLIGLKPTSENKLVFKPLIHTSIWPWFRMEKIPYHGKLVDLQWDASGKHFGSKGFKVWVDGVLRYQSNRLSACEIRLN